LEGNAVPVPITRGEWLLITYIAWRPSHGTHGDNAISPFDADGPHIVPFAHL
jgi:hypothetical protein